MNEPHVQLVLGQTGYGKTTLARQLVADAPRVIAFDPRQEYGMLALDWDDFCAYVDRMPLDHFRVSCHELDRGEEFCAIAYALGETVAERSGERIHVLLEEADLIGPPGREPAAFKKLVGQGRIFTGQRGGVQLVAVSRRPTEISPHVRAMTDELYVFRSQHGPDLKYFSEWIGDEATAKLQTFTHPRDNGGRCEFVAWTPSGVSYRQLAVRG